MSLGLAVFAGADVLGAGLGALEVRRAALLRGRRGAVRTGIALGASLAVYTALCLWLGFGLWAQLGASLAAAVPLVLLRGGRRG